MWNGSRPAIQIEPFRRALGAKDHDPAASAVRFHTYYPCPELAQHVSSISVVERDRVSSRVFKLPNGAAHLVFCVTAGQWNGASGALGATDGALNVLGTSTSVHEKAAATFPLSITVNFRPGGAYAFLALPMSELAGRNVSLAEVWGAQANRLCEELLEAPSNEARAQRLQETLLRRLRGCERAALRAMSLTRRAIALLDGTSAEQPRGVGALAGYLGTSARTLRRLFQETVGVSPKTLARVKRFDRTVRLARMGSAQDWALLATTAGYYDQAHMIDEFRQFSNLTPSALCRILEQDTASAGQG